MKNLVIGIAAFAVLAAAVYFIRLPRPAAVASLPAAEPVSVPTPSGASPTPGHDAPMQPDPARPHNTAPRREPAQLPNTQDVLGNSQGRPPQPDLPKDLAACHAMWESKRKREQAAHDAETKDPAWAYAMEQKLREYAARRFQGTSMELTEVECKTTHCDLIAQVLEPDSAQQLYDALDDVGKQPWSDFTGKSYAKVSDTGNDYRIELLRKHSYMTPFYDENNGEASLACMHLESDRALQERAALDNQPRDAAWADQLEPLLRQNIASRTAKHPVDKLEISCKTTFCRIAASGQTQDSQTLFQQAAQEVGAEPWAELHAGEAGGSGYGDSWKFEVTLYRK